MNRSDYFDALKDAEILQHHGIKGQKWGIRRYQNKDGTLTDAGIKKYYRINTDPSVADNQGYWRNGKGGSINRNVRKQINSDAKKLLKNKEYRKLLDDYVNSENNFNNKLKSEFKKKVGYDYDPSSSNYIHDDKIFDKVYAQNLNSSQAKTRIQKRDALANKLSQDKLIKSRGTVYKLPTHIKSKDIKSIKPEEVNYGRELVYAMRDELETKQYKVVRK